MYVCMYIYIYIAHIYIYIERERGRDRVPPSPPPHPPPHVHTLFLCFLIRYGAQHIDSARHHPGVRSTLSLHMCSEQSHLSFVLSVTVPLTHKSQSRESALLHSPKAARSCSPTQSQNQEPNVLDSQHWDLPALSHARMLKTMTRSQCLSSPKTNRSQVVGSRPASERLGSLETSLQSLGSLGSRCLRVQRLVQASF